MRLTIRDFTKYELEQMDLQCGCKSCFWKWLPVPELWFKQSCAEHDIDYAAGHTERDRILADKRFKRNLKNDVKRVPWYGKWFAQLAADVYYKAVADNGKGSFNYGDDYATKEVIMELLRKE